MFIRLEKVPMYERHLLFCSDLDERQTPDDVISMFATLPNVDGRLANPQLRMAALPIPITTVPRNRRPN